MLDAIKYRRSIRTYIDKAIEEEKIQEILKSAMQAPSSKNASPWEFVVIDDKSLLNEICQIHHKAKHVKDTNICIVVLGNKKRFIKPGKWIQDLGACTQNILLEATNQGLASCWVGIFPKAKVMKKTKEVLNLPDELIPYALVPISYSEEENKFINKFDENKIHRNRFNL